MSITQLGRKITALMYLSLSNNMFPLTNIMSGLLLLTSHIVSDEGHFSVILTLIGRLLF